MTGTPSSQAPGGPGVSAPTVGWWHRDHPVFTPLTGFFAGLVFVTVVPGWWIGLLRLILDYETAEQYFPLVLITLLLPIVLVATPRTRRFGLYMLLGMAITAVAVLGVASLVLWLMIAVGR